MGFFILDEEQTEVLLELDLATEETISRTAQITSAPVEDGADVSDHVRLDPEGGVFSGFLVNDGADEEEVGGRVGGSLEDIRASSPIDQTRAGRILAELQLLIINRDIVTISTSLELLTNVILTRVQGFQKAPGVIEVSGAYRVIRKAVTELVALPKPEVKAQSSKTKKKGSSKPKEASKDLQGKSIALTLSGG